MASTVSNIREAEAQVREFAREFPTANVLRGVALAESGRLTWFQVYEVFRVAAAKGIAAVA